MNLLNLLAQLVILAAASEVDEFCALGADEGAETAS